eukprot:Seg4608.2 transcript_id=Seg4608.2/GoldUCD/mRNA.D3Y31 product="hypothetical protein" protein_id=Seg4608.2/GoldUCD/D3Y31
MNNRHSPFVTFCVACALAQTIPFGKQAQHRRANKRHPEYATKREEPNGKKRHGTERATEEFESEKQRIDQSTAIEYSADTIGVSLETVKRGVPKVSLFGKKNTMSRQAENH